MCFSWQEHRKTLCRHFPTQERTTKWMYKLGKTAPKLSPTQHNLCNWKKMKKSFFTVKQLPLLDKRFLGQDESKGPLNYGAKRCNWEQRCTCQQFSGASFSNWLFRNWMRTWKRKAARKPRTLLGQPWVRATSANRKSAREQTTSCPASLSANIAK